MPGTVDVIDAIGAQPTAQSVPVRGNVLVDLEPGRIAVVTEGTVDVVFVPDRPEPVGGAGAPVFVTRLEPGDVAVGGWWMASSLALPAGTGRLRGIGEARVTVAGEPAEDDDVLVAARREWAASVQTFAAASASWLRDPGAEGARLAQRRVADAALEADGAGALAGVFHGRRLTRAPAGLPPLARALVEAADVGGAAVDPSRLAASAGVETGREGVLELAALLRIPVRRVTLRDRWWREPGVPLLAWVGDEPMALLPRRRGYVVRDQAGRTSPVRPSSTDAFDPTAYAVYPRLPDTTVRARDLVRVSLWRSRPTVVVLILVTLALAGLGSFLPYATGQIVGTVVPSGSRSALVAVLIALGVFAVTLLGASVVQALILLGLSTAASARLTAALWDRLLHLSPSFFRARPAGELALQATAFDQMRALVTSSLVAALASSTLALGGIGLLVSYTPVAALVDVALLALAGVAAAWAIRSYGRSLERTIDARNRLNGLLLGLFTGIAKLRVSGAERRAQAIWARGYGREQEAQLDTARANVGLVVLQATLPAVLFLGVLIVIGQLSADTVSLTAFTSAVAASGQVAVAAGSMISVAATVAQLRPLYRSAAPILHARPEVRAAAAPIGDVEGRLELADVTFGYVEGTPILNGVSFDIPAGRSLAIVGPSGTGKSTVLRLLLGFEVPWEGDVFLDDRPLRSLDLEAVRRRMGTVVQGARVTVGTLLTNILGTLPLGLDAAWEAAEQAGIADDIRRMPMGMSTMVSEGGGGFSGGQLQRVLLARALVRTPKILLLDEATSALDNQTQRVVADHLATLGVTRVIIAHRLSTIQRADKIVVLDQGRVVEQGPYDELVDAGGLFGRFVQRQTL